MPENYYAYFDYDADIGVIGCGSTLEASFVQAARVAPLPASQRGARAFASASHGAGCAMNRHQAIKLWRGTELVEELGEAGIIIRSGSMRGVAEEAPGAYKDVDLVHVALLKPKICVKG